MRRAAPAGSGVPNRVPRALAAGRQDVDAELLANGMSVATNSTPDSMGVATKLGLREPVRLRNDQLRASSFLALDACMTRRGNS